MPEFSADSNHRGPLPADDASYVTRSADDELFRALRAGELAYVLEPTGVGKTSLLLRTAARLRHDGIAAAVVDCAATAACRTAESWYAALLDQIASETGIGEELSVFFRSNTRLGCLQRWMAALRQVALPRLGEQPLTLFIDNVESARALPFPADEFFAGVRQACNARSGDPEMRRLTFCLSGASTPESLMKDTRTTPFNVGRRIRLLDFTEVETATLAEGALGAKCIERIHYWTGGHPCLTQRLYATLSGAPSARPSASDVDRVVATRFLPGTPETDTHTGEVARSLLHATGATALLAQYAKVLSSPCGGIREDSLGDPLCAALLMSGVVRGAGACLQPRNRIYERVFDDTWISAHAPGSVVRRKGWAGWPAFLKAAGNPVALWSR